MLNFPMCALPLNSRRHSPRLRTRETPRSGHVRKGSDQLGKEVRQRPKEKILTHRRMVTDIKKERAKAGEPKVGDETPRTPRGTSSQPQPPTPQSTPRDWSRVKPTGPK